MSPRACPSYFLAPLGRHPFSVLSPRWNCRPESLADVRSIIQAAHFLRCPMTPRFPAACSVLLFVLSLPATFSFADTPPRGLPTAPMTKETRMTVIRALNAELVYIRTPFPMGEKGLRLRGGVVSPSGEALQSMLAMFGPSVKPGDQARISNVLIRDKSIIFEINGGPRKKTKWYQRITVSGSGGEVPVAPSDQDANARGSYVELQFDHRVPDLSPAELKTLLRPVFDFDAKSAIESYLETVPPKVKEAIQKHQVLVGMNREMVTYAKGRAEKKIREKDGETEYEEWIYGEPPKDVEFVRLVGDEVVQMKIMKIDGERILRTQKEVDLGAPQAAVVEAEKAPIGPTHRPTLKRPGEEEIDPATDGSQSNTRPRTPPGAPPPSGPPNFRLGA